MKHKISLSTTIGAVLFVCCIAYVFMPFYLSTRFCENYYQGNNTIATGLFVVSMALIWLPEKRIKALVDALADKTTKSKQDE